MPFMLRDSVTNIRVPREVKEAARSAGIEDGRSLSGMVTWILKDWLTAKGYIRTVKARAPRKGRR